MQIVLHIGTDKTGSTSIQNTVFLNRDWLAARSVYVPVTGLGEGNGHSRLFMNFTDEAQRELAREVRLASDRGYQQVLLSWEGLASFRFGRRRIRALRAALCGFPIHVVVYLREQAEIIQSGHLQQVKRNRNTVRIRALEQPRTPLERAKAYIALNNPNRNYYRLLRRWQRCAPGSTFAVRIFDRRLLVGGDVVTDFLGALNVRRDAGFIPARPNYNESLDVEGALLIESLQQRPEYRADMVTLVDLTQSVINLEGQSTKHFLSESAVVSIRRHFRRSNLRLARHFMGCDTSPFKEPDNCWRSESLAAIEARAAQLSRKVDALRQIPTLVAEAAGGDIAAMVDLRQGWCGARPWGVWSSGDESRIRFRIYRHSLLQEIGSLRLLVEGRYYGGNRQTQVQINGVDFGDQALTPGGCELEIPVAALHANEVVEIVLRHHQPISPSVLEGGRDIRALAFGLERVGYVLLRKYQ